MHSKHIDKKELYRNVLKESINKKAHDRRYSHF